MSGGLLGGRCFGVVVALVAGGDQGWPYFPLPLEEVSCSSALVLGCKAAIVHGSVNSIPIARSCWVLYGAGPPLGFGESVGH